MTRNKSHRAEEAENLCAAISVAIEGLKTLLEDERFWKIPQTKVEDARPRIDLTLFPEFTQRLAQEIYIITLALNAALSAALRQVSEYAQGSEISTYLDDCEGVLEGLARQIQERKDGRVLTFNRDGIRIETKQTVLDATGFLNDVKKTCRVVFFGLKTIAEARFGLSEFAGTNEARDMRQSIAARVGDLGGQTAESAHTEADKQ